MTETDGSEDASGPWFIDTNLLVYANHATADPAKREPAKGLVARAWNGKIKLAVSNQILAEFFRVITTKVERPVAPEIARDAVEEIVTSDLWTKVGYTVQTEIAAIDLRIRYRMGFWDGLIAATMKENGIRRIYTEDEGAYAHPLGILAVNPFGGKSSAPQRKPR